MTFVEQPSFEGHDTFRGWLFLRGCIVVYESDIMTSTDKRVWLRGSCRGGLSPAVSDGYSQAAGGIILG